MNDFLAKNVAEINISECNNVEKRNIHHERLHCLSYTQLASTFNIILTIHIIIK